MSTTEKAARDPEDTEGDGPQLSTSVTEALAALDAHLVAHKTLSRTKREVLGRIHLIPEAEEGAFMDEARKVLARHEIPDPSERRRRSPEIIFLGEFPL
ncbi:MAG TPA: hypothetical protein VGR71_16740 [Nitrospira sp.]|nr:hypothetical protein [Nitrospira sp.]